jgi:hypothetical protein
MSRHLRKQYSQERAIGPYPEADEFRLPPPTLFP